MMTATATTVELLRCAPTSYRANQWLMAFDRAAKSVGVSVTGTDRLLGGSDWLVVWGPGAPDRIEAMRAQQAAGGRSVCFDLSYWQRETKVRVSIDAAHPQKWVMARDLPAGRLEADGVKVADTWNPTGPVIVAGIGRKARVQYGDAVSTWEASMIDAARQRWPKRRVLYRRKQADAPVPAGVDLAPDGPIDPVLKGASLLMTWHSNVAVDAIRLGIPVICRDGAAAAVCPWGFEVNDPEPLGGAVRSRFLINLAWFQWAPSEAVACWRFLLEVLQ